MMRRLIAIGACALALSQPGCTASPRSAEIRQWTDDLAITVAVTPLPPKSEIVTQFKVVVKDKETGQPIEHGEGRLFATNSGNATVYDGLAKGKELGTYYARIRFPISGDWAMGLQFRRDSTSRLQRTQDWVQKVNLAPTSTTLPASAPSSTPSH
jgi:hypothetical protein